MGESQIVLYCSSVFQLIWSILISFIKCELTSPLELVWYHFIVRVVAPFCYQGCPSQFVEDSKAAGFSWNKFALWDRLQERHQIVHWLADFIGNDLAGLLWPLPDLGGRLVVAVLGLFHKVTIAATAQSFGHSLTDRLRNCFPLFSLHSWLVLVDSATVRLEHHLAECPAHPVRLRLGVEAGEAAAGDGRVAVLHHHLGRLLAEHRLAPLGEIFYNAGHWSAHVFFLISQIH